MENQSNFAVIVKIKSIMNHTEAWTYLQKTHFSPQQSSFSGHLRKQTWQESHVRGRARKLAAAPSLSGVILRAAPSSSPRPSEKSFVDNRAE